MIQLDRCSRTGHRAGTKSRLHVSIHGASQKVEETTIANRKLHAEELRPFGWESKMFGKISGSLIMMHV